MLLLVIGEIQLNSCFGISKEYHFTVFHEARTFAILSDHIHAMAYQYDGLAFYPRAFEYLDCFFLELHITDGKYFVEEHDIGAGIYCNRKAKTSHHTG